MVIQDSPKAIENEPLHVKLHFHDILFGLMWKRKRNLAHVAIFFVIGAVITIWRLTFDCVNIVYLIHSMVIFTDLLLASIFSRSLLFNLALHIISMIHALWYWHTGSAVAELMETTMMAIISSIYELVLKFRHQKEIELVSCHESDWYQMHIYLQEKLGTTALEFIVEEFLDGAAGIMYTSFAGLIFSEIAVILYPDGREPLYCHWYN